MKTVRTVFTFIRRKYEKASARQEYAVDIEVKSRTENEFLCKWPEAIGRDLMRRSVVFSVVKFNEKFDVDEKAMDKYRDIRASILPE